MVCWLAGLVHGCIVTEPAAASDQSQAAPVSISVFIRWLLFGTGNTETRFVACAQVLRVTPPPTSCRNHCELGKIVSIHICYMYAARAMLCSSSARSVAEGKPSDTAWAMAATASFSPSSAYWQSASPTRLLAASQRLALAKLLHPRLPNGEALSADVDIFALLGEDFVRFREQEAYDAARDDPEVDACLLKTLDEKVEQRELWAVDILEQTAAEGEARAWRAAAAGRSAASPESEPCRLWADRGNATAARLLRLVRAALPTVGDQAPYTLLPFANLPCGSTDPRTLVWDFRSDGLHGVIEGASDVELFAREVVYRAGLQRPAEPYLPGNYGHPSHSTWRGGRH